MNKKQLEAFRRKYFREGYKLAIKSILTNESDSWIKDYDKRIEREDKEYEEKAPELSNIDIEQVIVDELFTDIILEIKSIIRKKNIDTNVSGFIKKHLNGMNQMDIFKTIVPNIDDTAEYIIDSIQSIYNDFNDYGIDYDDYSFDDVKNIIISNTKEISRAFSKGNIPNNLLMKIKDTSGVHNKSLKEAALWVEDKDDAIGLPDGGYLYNTFLEGMEKLIRSYRNLERYIEQYENMDENEASKLALSQCKKNIAKAYADVRMKLTELSE